MNKQGKSNKNNWIIGLVIVLILVAGFGFYKLGAFGQLGAQPLVVTQQQQVTSNCAIALAGQKQSFDVSALDIASKVALVGETYIFKYGGVDRGTVTGGTAATVSPAQDYSLLVSNTSYYRKTVSGTSPCQSEFTLQPELAKEGALTFSVINSDGVTANANSTAPQAIGDSAMVTMKILITENGAKAYWSNPDLGYFGYGMDWNTTEFSKANTVVAIDGATVSPDNVPNRLTGTVDASWKVPTTLFNSQVKTLYLTLAAKDSVNPVGGTTSVDGGTRIKYYFYDADYYQNTVTGAFESGYENNVDTDTGTSDQTGYIYYS